MPSSMGDQLIQLYSLGPLTGTVKTVDGYGADPTGATDSTAAFQAALAALPTVTVWGTAFTPGKPGTNGSGTSATYPVGTITLGAGTYRIGTTTDIGNLGPFVNVTGPGHTACTIDYRGSGAALRAYNAVRPAGDTFFTLNGMAGRFDGFTIAGENSIAGSRGLHIGDGEGWVIGPDLYIRSFAGVIAAPVITLGTTATTGGTFAASTYYWKVSAATAAGFETPLSNQVTTAIALNGSQVINWTAIAGVDHYNIYRADSANHYNLAGTATGTTFTDTGATIGATLGAWVAPAGAGGIGLLFDNNYSWTENVRGWATIFNCNSCVVFNAGNGSTTQGGFVGGDNSFMYNDLTFKLYCFEQQNGVVLQNGATYQGGRLVLTGNMKNNAAATTNAFIVLTGQCPTGHLGAGTWSQFMNTELQVRAETNGSGNHPQTIKFGAVSSNAVWSSAGFLSFTGGASSWTPSNYSLASSFAGGNFQFGGLVSGDTNLAPAPGFQTTSTTQFPLTTLFANSGTLVAYTGDFASTTLTQNITIGFGAQNKAAAQRKTVILKQAASGGPFTVTWPKPGSPTLTAPTVLWAGGTAPTMTATASAVDVYDLSTIDGITWHGRAVQNVS